MDSALNHALPMSADELQVLSLLKDRSKKNAICNEVVQQVTGLEERRIRRIVRELIVMYRQPIGSSTTDGYYWISDIAELEDNHRRLRRRGLQILIRAYALKKVYDMDEMLKQLKLDLQEVAR